MTFDLARFDTREAWLEARRGVGASELATIAGLNRYESSLALWARKVGVIDEQGDNLSMAFGRRIESIVLDLFAEQTGFVVERAEGLVLARSRSHPWAFCSPDGFVWEGRHEPGAAGWETCAGVVEAKSTSVRVDLDDPADLRAAAWIAQVQWQLFVTGFEHGWLAVLDSFRDEVRIEPVKRDDEAIEWLVAEGERFNSFVETQTRPPVDAHPASLRLYPRLWPAASGAEIEIEPELAERVRQARRDLARAEQAMAEARADVLEAIRLDDGTSGEFACVGGQRVVRYKQSRALDVEAIEREHDVSAFVAPRFDVHAWAKANRKISEQYRTLDGARPFVVLGVDEDDS